MAHLGKRRADALDVDDYIQPSIKRHHAGHDGAPLLQQTAALEQVSIAAQQPVAPQAPPPGLSVPDQQTGFPPAAASAPSAAVTPGATLSPGASPAAPVACTDLVLYQPQQQPVFGAFSSLSAPSEARPLLQHQPAVMPPQQQQSLLQQLKQHTDLDTASNDNAALKSVWRSLTAAQKRSLAGMWDMIKTEDLLPRLVPQSGLLALPSTNDSSDNSRSNGQQWQREPACIVEVHDDADEAHAKQQQQQTLAANGFPPMRNGFTQPGAADAAAAAAAPSAAAAGVAEAPAGDVEMQLDQQPSAGLPLGPSRQPSVEDMEM